MPTDTRLPPPTLPQSRQRVDADVVIRRLQRFQALEILTARLLGGWIPGVAVWEVKHQLGAHLWQDASHSREWRTRLWELRVPNPDRGLGEQPRQIIRALGAAQADYEVLAGVYFALKTELAAAYARLAETTNPVFDAPTLAVIRRILPEKEAQLAWARQAVPALATDDAARHRLERWTAFAREALAAAGGVEGEIPAAAEPVTPPPGYGVPPLPFPAARRDARFTVNLTGMPLPPEDDVAGRVRYQFFNYAMEMQAVETLGSVLWETEGMEWEFYYDLARHCYDEERHSAMGEMRLRELGHGVADFPHSVANYAWRQLFDPLRRYCVLTYVIEADSFRYKHQTYQQHLARGDLESAQAVLWDIMDETLHVRFGQKWVPELMQRYRYEGSLEALEAECREILRTHTVNPLQRKYAEPERKPAS
ncbi:MAG: DUF455 family protein [Opitutaceae bacterium]|nr:DUF455 family protein [Opitutaceae bacterium]